MSLRNVPSVFPRFLNLQQKGQTWTVNIYFVMDPDEVEFIGEKLSIGIIPNFNFEPIHLISNTIGRFC